MSTRNWCTMVIVLIAGLLSVQTIAANTKQTVEQVTANVTIADDVDYVITSATPFAEGAVVDIENTERAVVILQAVKPSAALKLLDHLTIRGEKAANNKNCQVKLYNRGTIILPYASTLRPLTVFSEKDFKGDAADDFGLGNTGGFMNTMSEAQLNNRVRSFKLKRGYMVTFSTLPSGRGYSRCFIAAYNDLEFKTLPAVLDPFTFHSQALENEMATHFSVLAWRIPGTEEPGGLPSMGSHRVGHD